MSVEVESFVAGADVLSEAGVSTATVVESVMVSTSVDVPVLQAENTVVKAIAEAIKSLDFILFFLFNFFIYLISQ